MRSNLILASVSVFSLLAGALSPCMGQKSKSMTPPVFIDATVAALDEAHAVKAGIGKFFVEGLDVEGGGDSAVGQTRTGRKTVSLIVCDPAPAVAVRQTLANALSAQGLLAESAAGASFVIEADASLILTETSKTLRQTLSASLSVNVAIRSVSDPNRVKKLKIESEGERKHLDTSKQAELAAREAVRTAVGEILKNLDSL